MTSPWSAAAVPANTQSLPRVVDHTVMDVNRGVGIVYVVKIWNAAADLLSQAAETLEAHEVENNLVLGLCADLVRRPSYDPWWLATVESPAGVVGAAVRSPGHPVVLTRLPVEAVDALVESLCALWVDLDQAVGPAETVTAFAGAWSHRTGRQAALHVSQRLYDCREVTRPQHVSGQFRAAVASDQALLVAWVRDFHQAVGIPVEGDRVDGLVAGRLAAGQFWVWEDGGLVSLAGFSRETRHGAAINHVYTPPEFRRRGYAGACVAALTQRLLDAGKQYCCLYTDLSNPTSNHIYQQIGFRPVCDAQTWKFTA